MQLDGQSTFNSSVVQRAVACPEVSRVNMVDEMKLITKCIVNVIFSTVRQRTLNNTSFELQPFLSLQQQLLELLSTLLRQYIHCALLITTKLAIFDSFILLRAYVYSSVTIANIKFHSTP